MLSSGSSAKHSWSQWRRLGKGDCQREEEGEPRAPVAGVRFPHHEEIVWPRFWNHKMLSEAKGERWEWRTREKGGRGGRGFASRKNCGVEAAGPVLPWA